MAQKTAVEWLAKELENYGNPQVCEINWEILDAFINKAKQMEKEQMKESWFDSTLQFDNAASTVYKKEFEQYYNEIYGK